MSSNIAALLMVKDEKDRILVTLSSIIGTIKTVIVYDTGSTDNTIELIKNFCKENNLTLRLKEGEFVDFATSRNVSLDFADEFNDIDFLLLMDVNDELRGGKELKKFCDKMLTQTDSGFLVCQMWFSGDLSKYYNMRLVKPKHGWRYNGVVHEWLARNVVDDNSSKPVRVPDNVCLYQDRTKDGMKSYKRFYKDKILLENEYKKNPKDTRTVFYLAQTYSCINELPEAYRFYKLRTMMEGFFEERYYSYYKCGEISSHLKHPWEVSLGWYMKAFEYMRRVEPLLKIAEHYIEIKQWDIAFDFLSRAITLEYPSHLNLFIDKNAYDYKRWHLLGWVGYYCGKKDEGRMGCLKALENKPDSEIDKKNLEFYKIKKNKN